MENPDLAEHLYYLKYYSINYLEFFVELGLYNPFECGYLQRNQKSEEFFKLTEVLVLKRQEKLWPKILIVQVLGPSCISGLMLTSNVELSCWIS